MQHDDIELLQQSIMHGGERAFEVVPLALKKVLVERQWLSRADKNGKPFASFEAFATHRLWQGLETSIDDLRVHCRKHPDVERLILAEMEPGATHADAGAKGGRGNKAADNIKGFGGTSATYTLKRLKRDRPELFERVVTGELSANAAAIEAGFRKPPASTRRIAELEEVCAQLYQVIGSLADYAGCFDHPDVQRALDNASRARLVHDLIPWPRQPLPGEEDP